MLQLTAATLPAKIATQLQNWQNEIDGKSSFTEQVATAKTQFKAKNKSTNPTFKVVRSKLGEMHGELIRCAYCEDSVADEVEHVYPKDIFPGKAFSWENYVYSCGPCNGPKNNKFAVFLTADGSEQNVTPPHPKQRPIGWVRTPPPPGDALLIDPRTEDPLDFLWLDLMGTWRIDPKAGLTPRNKRRAEYTRDTLDLNRDFLTRARRNALFSSFATFEKYTALKTASAPTSELLKHTDVIKSMVHRTVWKEMIRQRHLIPKLKELFAANPEAISW